VYSNDYENPEYIAWEAGGITTAFDRRAILPDLPSGAWVWVRPIYEQSGEEGPVSNVIQVP